MVPGGRDFAGDRLREAFAALGRKSSQVTMTDRGVINPRITITTITPTVSRTTSSNTIKKRQRSPNVGRTSPPPKNNGDTTTETATQEPSRRTTKDNSRTNTIPMAVKDHRELLQRSLTRLTVSQTAPSDDLINFIL